MSRRAKSSSDRLPVSTLVNKRIAFQLCGWWKSEAWRCASLAVLPHLLRASTRAQAFPLRRPSADQAPPTYGAGYFRRCMAPAMQLWERYLDAVIALPAATPGRLPDGQLDRCYRCPPAFFLSTPPQDSVAGSCHRSHICPWCWGRAVATAFHALRDALKRLVAPGRLVTFRSTLLAPPSAAALRDVVDAQIVLRQRMRSCAGLLGGLVHGMLIPPGESQVARGQNSCQSQLRAVLVMPPGTYEVDLDPWLLAKGRVRMITGDNQISRAVLSLFRYPTQLLTASASLTTALFAARAGRQLSARFGVLRAPRR